MTTQGKPQKEELLLNVFCSPLKGSWRVYLGASWLPPYLQGYFDADGEAYPPELDFEELERQAQKQGAAIEQRIDKLGGVELTARGASAKVLASWLATAFASSAYSPPSQHGKVAG